MITDRKVYRIEVLVHELTNQIGKDNPAFRMVTGGEVDVTFGLEEMYSFPLMAAGELIEQKTKAALHAVRSHIQQEIIEYVMKDAE
jgi:hypothetical protein